MIADGREISMGIAYFIFIYVKLFYKLEKALSSLNFRQYGNRVLSPRGQGE